MGISWEFRRTHFKWFGSPNLPMDFGMEILWIPSLDMWMNHRQRRSKMIEATSTGIEATTVELVGGIVSTPL